MSRPFDTKLLPLLQDIARRSRIPLDELQKQFGCTKAQLRYMLAKINDYLTTNGMQEIVVQDGVGRHTPLGSVSAEFSLVIQYSVDK